MFDAEQVWDLLSPLDNHVRFPQNDVLGFIGHDPVLSSLQVNPTEAARYVREASALGLGPIPQVVLTVEALRILWVLVPLVEDEIGSAARLGQTVN